MTGLIFSIKIDFNSLAGFPCVLETKLVVSNDRCNVIYIVDSGYIYVTG